MLIRSRTVTDGPACFSRPDSGERADFAFDCVQVADIQRVNETLSATLNDEIEPISFSDEVNDSNEQVRERVGLKTCLVSLMNFQISNSTAQLIYAAVVLLSLAIGFWFKTL